MGLFGSPGRTLATIVGFVLAVIVVATVAYAAAGWSLGDAFYMVLLTVYTVGYGEVHPVNSPYLHAVTIGTMIFGCTGMILLTGALVQYLTITQLQNLIGMKRMTKEIDHLSHHVIVVGYGRIGALLARDLRSGGAAFVILDGEEKRIEEARAQGHLCIHGDATDEETLRHAGITRARAIATVLPNDAANVFITLSARSLNREIEIIARGEAASTESKLRHAGANHVVQPTHIGAERMAEMILFPAAARQLRSTAQMQGIDRTLRGLGLDMEAVVAPEKGPMTGLSVAEIEARAEGRFFIVQVNRKDGQTLAAPPPELKVNAGDGLIIVGRLSPACRALFDPGPEPPLPA